MSTHAALSREGAVALVLAKHHLTSATAATDVRTVIEDLVGLHATVARSPYVQLRARMGAFAPDRLDALLEHGGAARVGCMRRTLFVESAALVPLVHAATRELARRGRERFLAASGLSARRYARLADRVADALVGRALSARELRTALDAGESLAPVLIVMCDEGRLVRWRAAGGWDRTPPTYRRMDEALPGVDLGTWEPRAALRALVERYVRRYGPVRERDVVWWTGLGSAAVRDALAAVEDVVRIAVDGQPGEYLVCEGDVAQAARLPAPTAADVSLLDLLDPYLQGYRDRERAIDERHREFVLDGAGNTTSVILVAGRAAGVWQLCAAPSPELRLLFFDRPPAATIRRVRDVAEGLAAFLSDEPVRVVECERMTPLPRRTTGSFQTPLADAR